MKILIVEDELKTGNYLKQGLLEAGFVVDLVCDGIDGLHYGLSEAYDLVILDVMLPGMDGRCCKVSAVPGRTFPFSSSPLATRLRTGSRGLNWVPTTIW